jgi:hypothetical protein
VALYILGMRCVLCHLPMVAGEDTTSFSPFLANKRDPLFRFSDATVHTSCVNRDSLGHAALELQVAVNQHTRIAERVCTVCRQPIRNPDEYAGLGVLTSDRLSPLHPFNFLEFHREHIGQWPRYQEFRRLMETVQISDAWDGPHLTFINEPGPSFHWSHAPSS